MGYIGKKIKRVVLPVPAPYTWPRRTKPQEEDDEKPIPIELPVKEPAPLVAPAPQQN